MDNFYNLRFPPNFLFSFTFIRSCDRRFSEGIFMFLVKKIVRSVSFRAINQIVIFRLIYFLSVLFFVKVGKLHEIAF